jgi:cytochrome c peroxidase
VTSKLAALQYYELSIPAPTPPAGSFDPAAGSARRGALQRQSDLRRLPCAPLFSEPGWPMHTASEMGIDNFQADRSPDVRYRTTPLHGLFARAKGGYYHDGRFADLNVVVDHYNTTRRLGLGAEEKRDLVEYLRSL